MHLVKFKKMFITLLDLEKVHNNTHKTLAKFELKIFTGNNLEVKFDGNFIPKKWVAKKHVSKALMEIWKY